MNVLGINTREAKRAEEKIRRLRRNIGKMSFEKQRLMDKGVLLVVDITNIVARKPTCFSRGYLTGNYTYDFCLKSCLEHVKFPITSSYCSFGNYEEALHNGLIYGKKILKRLNKEKNNNIQVEICDYVQVPF